MKNTFSNEAKTGLLVLVSVAVLVGLIVKVSGFTFADNGYDVKAVFNFTAGVKKNAPVRLSGVDVGTVKDIRLVYGDNLTIEVLIRLNHDVKLRVDSKAYVSTLGMMGEKYIEIKSGTPSTAYAKEGDMITGVDPVRLEELLETATKLADDISSMAKNIDKTVTHVDELLVDNKPKLSRIFDNLEETSVNFRHFSEDIKWHPWKILAKGKEKTREEMERERQAKLNPAPPAPAAAAVLAPGSFSPKKRR